MAQALDKRLSRFGIFSSLFIFAMFFPTFFMSIGRLGAMIINGTLLIVGATLLYIYFNNLDKYIIKGLPLKILAYLWAVSLLIMVFSYINGAYYADIMITERDLYDLYKPLFYIVIFTLSYVSIMNIDDIRKYEKLLVILFLILFLMAVLQFFKLYPDFFSQYTKFHNIKSGRVSAPFVNPYDYAFIASFFAYYFFINYIYKGSKLSLLYFCFATLMILTTQSRSILGSYLIGLFVVSPFLILYLNRGSIFRLKLNKAMTRLLIMFLFTFFSFVGLYIYAMEYFPYIVYGFETVLSGERLNSASIRWEQMLFAIESASLHPMLFLFGHGPSKDIMPFVESYYVYGFYRYGIVGLFTLFVLPLLLMVNILIKLLAALGPRHDLYSLFLAILIWMVILPVSSLGNNFIEQLRVSFFYYSLLAIILKSYLLLKEREKWI